MRVVLDSNIFISALISKSGAPFLVYKAWQKRRIDLVCAVEQIDELKNASRYAKFKGVIAPHIFGQLINLLSATELVRVAAVETELSDPDDVFLLGIASAGEADYLVTGDKRAGLLALKTFGRTQIVTPTEFIAAIGG
jgi:uncharacterized protein